MFEQELKCMIALQHENIFQLLAKVRECQIVSYPIQVLEMVKQFPRVLQEIFCDVNLLLTNAQAFE